MIEHPALGLRSENRSATAMGTDDNAAAVCHLRAFDLPQCSIRKTRRC